MQNYKEFKQSSLKNPKIKSDYDELEAEYQIIDQIIASRLELKLTQKDLAKRIGTKQPSIARFEQKLVHPTVKFLSKIANAMNKNLVIRFEDR